MHPYTAANFRQFVKDEFGRAEGMAGFKPSSELFNAMYAFGDEHMVDGRSYMVRRDVACNVSVGEDIADDYMAVAHILNDAIVKACHQL